jgi:hypothetical protein
LSICCRAFEGGGGSGFDGQDAAGEEDWNKAREGEMEFRPLPQYADVGWCRLTPLTLKP